MKLQSFIFGEEIITSKVLFLSMRDELSWFVEDERMRRDIYESVYQKLLKNAKILKTFNPKSSSKMYEVMNILDKYVRHSVKHFQEPRFLL